MKPTSLKLPTVKPQHLSAFQKLPLTPQRKAALHLLTTKLTAMAKDRHLKLLQAGKHPRQPNLPAQLPANQPPQGPGGQQVVQGSPPEVLPMPQQEIQVDPRAPWAEREDSSEASGST